MAEKKNPKNNIILPDNKGIVYDGFEGPGKGKHIVFVVGDEEYRSEESMPQMAKILAKHHGFKCTVLFPIDPKNGKINPMVLNNIPGLEALEDADLMVIYTRFRELPDSQMKRIIDYTNSGKPILGLRTSTHAFSYEENPDSKYAKYHFENEDKDFRGGYGRQVLGETWVNHHGEHEEESTRGIIAEGMEKHPIVQGCDDIWGASDVYGLTTLHGDCKPLIIGLCLKGMKPTDKVNKRKKPVPVTWLKSYTGDKGKKARVFTTTMGHVMDFTSEGTRRMIVNGAYWCLGMEDKIPAKSKVDIVGTYNPTYIGYGDYKRGVAIKDHKM